MSADAHPLRRNQLELIARCSDPDQQRAKLAIFFSRLDPEQTIARLADYRHSTVMEDPETAAQIIAELIDKDQEAKTT